MAAESLRQICDYTLRLDGYETLLASFAKLYAEARLMSDTSASLDLRR